MSQFTVDIPQELEDYIKSEGYSKAEDYIEIVLIRPLIEKYEFKRRQQELEKIEPNLDKEFKRHRDKVAIVQLGERPKKIVSK